MGAALIVFLPEHLFGGGDLFRLSDRHGPSLADGVGLVSIMGGWLYFLHALWSRRHALLPRSAAFACIAAMLIAGASCIAAFAADRDAWGIALALMAVAAQFGLAILARRA
jgi:hypothetical protein